MRTRRRAVWFLVLCIGLSIVAVAVTVVRSPIGPSRSDTCTEAWVGRHASVAVKKDVASGRLFTPPVQRALSEATEACYHMPRTFGLEYHLDGPPPA
jgi:hypothetical protein